MILSNVMRLYVVMCKRREAQIIISVLLNLAAGAEERAAQSPFSGWRWCVTAPDRRLPRPPPPSPHPTPQVPSAPVHTNRASDIYFTG